MISMPFEYSRATSLDDALAQLAQTGGTEADEGDVFDADRAHAASSFAAHARSVLAKSCGSWPCMEWPIAGKDW